VIPQNQKIVAISAVIKNRLLNCMFKIQTIKETDAAHHIMTSHKATKGMMQLTGNNNNQEYKTVIYNITIQ